MHLSTFQALADPTRLRLVEALLAGERAVNDLVDQNDIHQSGVSRHLRLLHGAGLVQVRREGAQRFYSLRPEPFQELEAWIVGYRNLWEGRLTKFERALELKGKARRARKERQS